MIITAIDNASASEIRIEIERLTACAETYELWHVAAGEQDAEVLFVPGKHQALIQRVGRSKVYLDASWIRAESAAEAVKVVFGLGGKSGGDGMTTDTIDSIIDPVRLSLSQIEIAESYLAKTRRETASWIYNCLEHADLPIELDWGWRIDVDDVDVQCVLSKDGSDYVGDLDKLFARDLLRGLLDRIVDIVSSPPSERAEHVPEPHPFL